MVMSTHVVQAHKLTATLLLPASCTTQLLTTSSQSVDKQHVSISGRTHSTGPLKCCRCLVALPNVLCIGNRRMSQLEVKVSLQAIIQEQTQYSSTGGQRRVRAYKQNTLTMGANHQRG